MRAKKFQIKDEKKKVAGSHGIFENFSKEMPFQLSDLKWSIWEKMGVSEIF